MVVTEKRVCVGGSSSSSHHFMVVVVVVVWEGKENGHMMPVVVVVVVDCRICSIFMPRYIGGSRVSVLLMTAASHYYHLGSC